MVGTERPSPCSVGEALRLELVRADVPECSVSTPAIVECLGVEVNATLRVRTDDRSYPHGSSADSPRARFLGKGRPCKTESTVARVEKWLGFALSFARVSRCC